LKESALIFVYLERYERRGGKKRILPVGTLGRHANGLSACIRRLEEVAQLLLEDVKALRARCVGHAEDGAPEVEGVGHVGADAHED
jgi:hypothetical protein